MTPGEATWTTTLTFDEGEQISSTFAETETFNTTMDQIVEVTTSDHRKLTHRDAASQHPIGAIDSLDGELQARPSSALTNTDILNILNS